MLDLERAFCDRFGARFAVSVNSATSGLHAALIAVGVCPGDEVIVPPYTMSASATAVLMCGGVPVFADIEQDKYCISVHEVQRLISSKTKAIVAVNLFGLPADLGGLTLLAKNHGIALIEDNAQAPGAQYCGKWTGIVGDIGVFSLNRHKTMHCGEGGVVRERTATTPTTGMRVIDAGARTLSRPCCSRTC